MKTLALFFFTLQFSYTIVAQQKAIPIDTMTIQADHFWGVDSFDAIYYSNGAVFYKKLKNQEWQYGDLSLGKLTQVSIINPLKIVLFYETTNTVILVDKFLTEIDRVNFNTITEFKNIIQLTAANDDRLWIFNNDTQQLEIFDTNTNKTTNTTQPLNNLPIMQRSNFNYCWLLTEQEFLQFNSYGSLLNRIEKKEYTDFQITNNDLILKKENNLYYYSTHTKKTEKIILPKIPIKQFHVTNQILYIYDLTKVYSFTLTPSQK